MRISIALISLLCASPLVADDADYWRARVAASIAGSERVVDELPVPPAVPIVAPNKVEQKTIRIYTAKWCGPCQQRKAGLKAVKLPFTIQEIDVDVSGWPQGIPKQDEGIPHFQWEDSTGRTLYLKTWVSVPDLVRKWEFSQKPAVKAAKPIAHGPQNRYPSFAGYRPHWTYPGNLKDHLKTAHGVYEADQLSFSQQAKIHDFMHQTGYSAQQIRSYYSH